MLRTGAMMMHILLSYHLPELDYGEHIMVVAEAAMKVVLQ